MQWKTLMKSRLRGLPDDRQLRLVHLHNLVQYLGELGADVHVRRNDAISRSSRHRAALAPTPGLHLAGTGSPARPASPRRDPPRSPARLPVLGVCPGAPGAGEAWRQIVARQAMMHGKGPTCITPTSGRVRRSAAAVRVPRVPLAGDQARHAAAGAGRHRQFEGEIMGVRHREAVEGVQFHPESILTRAGRDARTSSTAQPRQNQPGRAMIHPQHRSPARVIEHREIFHDEMLAR